LAIKLWHKLALTTVNNVIGTSHKWTNAFAREREKSAVYYFSIVGHFEQ